MESSLESCLQAYCSAWSPELVSSCRVNGTLRIQYSYLLPLNRLCLLRSLKTTALPACWHASLLSSEPSYSCQLPFPLSPSGSSSWSPPCLLLPLCWEPSCKLTSSSCPWPLLPKGSYCGFGYKMSLTDLCLNSWFPERLCFGRLWSIWVVRPSWGKWVPGRLAAQPFFLSCLCFCFPITPRCEEASSSSPA